MQVPRVEDVVTGEDDPEEYLRDLSEYPLPDFLSDEPDISAISDLLKGHFGIIENAWGALRQEWWFL
jgi:hypothetical protein